MGQRRSEEFQRETVRIALTSGQPRQQVAADLGVWLSSLTKWIRLYLAATTLNLRKMARLLPATARGG